VPTFIAAALSERIGRPVTVDEIGMATNCDDPGSPAGWDFPRDRSDAIQGVRAHWSAQDNTRIADRFAATGYACAVTRWLAVPTDSPTAGHGPRRCGSEDLHDLRKTAEQARLWDARFGGGDWRLSSVTHCLRDRALPLLAGSYTEQVGHELFTITAELARVVAWAAFDSGHSGAAQRHFIQALRLARAAGDVETGAYILTTMALHTILEGHPDQALDMAQGAYHRAGRHAAPRVLAFAKLVEARAHSRLADAASASTALSRAEALLDKIQPGAHDPTWISYVTYARLAADATEIFRDLHNPKAALRWNEQASDMSPHVHTRAVGLRLAIAATAACQARDLDHALDCGHRALEILTRVSSTRAQNYLRAIANALTPWADAAPVRDFTEHLDQPHNHEAEKTVIR
jgi:tetratricopeptide (TPR) repeat protein